MFLSLHVHQCIHIRHQRASDSTIQKDFHCMCVCVYMCVYGSTNLGVWLCALLCTCGHVRTIVLYIYMHMYMSHGMGNRFQAIAHAFDRRADDHNDVHMPHASHIFLPKITIVRGLHNCGTVLVPTSAPDNYVCMHIYIQLTSAHTHTYMHIDTHTRQQTARRDFTHQQGSRDAKRIHQHRDCTAGIQHQQRRRVYIRQTVRQASYSPTAHTYAHVP